jgi:uncharacterized damage-inducible protein DinB
MELKEFFLAKLEREIEITRKAVERAPEGQDDWKPHPKSMELGYLASLVATMLGWIDFMIETDFLDFDSPEADSFKTKTLGSRAAMLAALEEAAAKSRKALENTTEEHLFGTWEFRMNGQVISGGPRHIMIADAVFSHLAHHRGQLTVYLRLNDASVPAIYGPSADEFH